MTRDDFEEWLNDHTPEALHLIRGDEMALPAWIRMYARALAFEAKAEDDEDED